MDDKQDLMWKKGAQRLLPAKPKVVCDTFWQEDILGELFDGVT